MGTAAGSTENTDPSSATFSYFVVINGSRLGPLNATEVRAANVPPEAWVWRDGLSGWMHAEELDDLRTPVCAPSQPRGATDESKSTGGQATTENAAQVSAELTLSWPAKLAVLLAFVVGLSWLPAFGPSPATFVVWLVAAIASVVGYIVFAIVTTTKNGRHSDEIAIVGLQRFFMIATVGLIGLVVFQRFAIGLAGSPTNISYGTPTTTAGVWITKIIGYAYGHAFSGNPEQGFWTTLAAMFCSVAICEEFLKLLPVAYLLSRNKLQRSSELMFVAALSGFGFGVGEGVFFSLQVYGPTGSPLSMYLYRFFGIALGHGLLTMLGAIVLNGSNRTKPLAYLPADHRDRDIAVRTALCGLVPAVPHAFYNAFAGHGMGFWAGLTDVLVIVIVVAWFAMQEEPTMSKSPAAR